MVKSSLLVNDLDVGDAPSMKWVKGELLSSLEPERIDPRGQLAAGGDVGPFSNLEWFARVQRYTSGGGEPIVAQASSEGAYCWLFLSRDGVGKASALANWYSLSFKPVFAGQVEPKLLIAIVRRLARARSVPAEITLSPVPRRDGVSDQLLAAFRSGGWLALRHQSSTSWIARTQGKSFADYWAERPGQLRSTFKRKLAKSAVETEILSRFDANAWTDYESVYGESWKDAEGNPDFLRDFAEAEGARGQLRLGLARLDGKVIAAQFWTVEGGTAYIHKLAHREEFRELSPGTILSVALFRHVLDDDKVHTIDFGTGNDPYKADWMDESAPLDTIRLYRKASLSGLIGYLRARLSALVRRTKLD